MTLWTKIFTTRTLIIVALALGALVVIKASIYYNIDWASAFAGS
jgi:hypothetical protein